MSFATDKATHHSGHKHLMPHWLVHLGLPGVFAVSIIDASIIPLPLPGSTDFLVLLLAANHGNPWLLAIAAIAGSMIGGYLTWKTGKGGGEAALRRYVPERFLAPIQKRVQQQGVLTVGVASILPPPIPLMPFLLAAGALGMSRNRFMVTFFVARSARYSLIVWLGATYGHQVIRVWTHYLAGWSDVILWAFLGLLVAAILFGFWKYKHDQKSHAGEAHAAAG